MTFRNMDDIVRDKSPVVLPPTATVRQACERMRECRIGAVLVIEGDRRLLGIFTGRDAVCRVLADGKNPENVLLQEAMTSNPATLSPAVDAIAALRLMQDGGFRHIPIVESGRVMGIVSRGDFRGHELDRLDEENAIWDRI